jgi:hypothetical protein
LSLEPLEQALAARSCAFLGDGKREAMANFSDFDSQAKAVNL